MFIHAHCDLSCQCTDLGMKREEMKSPNPIMGEQAYTYLRPYKFYGWALWKQEKKKLQIITFCFESIIITVLFLMKK